MPQLQTGVSRLSALTSQIKGFFGGGEKLAAKTIRKKQRLEIESYAPNRYRKDIMDWERAFRAAENPTLPQRVYLWQIYLQIVGDAHVAAQLQTRTNAVIGQDFALLNAEGKTDPEKTALLMKPWFRELLEVVAETPYWGFSLIELGDVIDGELQGIYLIPRINTEPVQGIVYLDSARSRPFAYRGSAFEPFLLEIGKPTHLGLLNTIVAPALYKRVITEWWARFCELFGLPFRIGKTSSTDATERMTLFNTLKEMGNAAFGVLNTEEQIEFITNSQSDSFQVFDKFIDRLNSEISKAVLGVTMLSDNGSSKSQAAVHMEVFEKLVKSQQRYVEDIINFTVLPKLAALGYDFTNLRFAFQKEVSTTLEQELSLVKEGYTIAPEYFADKYNIPLTKEPAAGKQSLNTQRDAIALSDGIPNAHACPDCGTPFNHDNAIRSLALSDDLAQLMRNIEQAIYNDELPADTINSEAYLTIAQYLNNGFTLALADNRSPIDYSISDISLREGVRNNLFAFSGAKSFAQMQELRDAVFTPEGEKVPYTEFRNKALAIHDKYNEQWLAAEYQAVVGSGIAAGKWAQIQADKAVYPYLTYRTQGDDKVRPEHVALNGITRPVDDSFWQSYYPPNGWLCRCAVRQATQGDVDSGRIPLSDEATANKAAAKEVDKYWRNNVALSRIVFKDNVPYYQHVPGASVNALTPTNYGLRSIEKIYAAADKLPSITPGVADKEVYAAWFEAMKKAHGNAETFTLKDTNATPVRFTKQSYSTLLKGDYWQYANEIQPAIESPDEVWATDSSTVYLRFFADKPAVLVVQDGVVKTFMQEADITTYRMGILLFRNF